MNDVNYKNIEMWNIKPNEAWDAFIENNYIALIPKSKDSCIEFKPLQNPMCIQLLVLVLQFLHVLH